MLFSRTLLISFIASCAVAVNTGKYCGTAIFWGNKLTCSMDVNAEASTVVFELHLNGENPSTHADPVSYTLEDSKFVLDETNEAFNSFLAAQFSLFTVKPSNIVSVYDSETDRLDSKIVLPFFSIDNVLTKAKCAAPFLVGTYTNADSKASAVVSSTDAKIEIDLGEGHEAQTFSYTVDASGKLVLEGASDMEAMVMPGDVLLVGASGNVVALQWSS